MPPTTAGSDPAHRPRAVLIGGAPGTGKSTLAAALAPRLRAALLDLDVATGPLTRVVGDLLGLSDLSHPRLAALTRAPRYETLLALAADNVSAGLPVVLVAPFTAERSVRGWTAATDRLPGAAVPVLVWLHLTPDQLIHRLRRRSAVRDADKVADPDAFLATVDAEPPEVRHLALDAGRPVPDLVDDVLAYLARPGLAIDGTA